MGLINEITPENVQEGLETYTEIISLHLRRRLKQKMVGLL